MRRFPLPPLEPPSLNLRMAQRRRMMRAGGTERLSVEGIRLLMEDGSIADPVLTCHEETVDIAGYECYLLKDTPADSDGYEEYVSAGKTGYMRFFRTPIWGCVFQLTGVAKILASTWTHYFRSYITGDAVAHGNIYAETIYDIDATSRDLLFLFADSGDTPNFPSSYGTVSGVTNVAEYTVVDQTDWLGISFAAHVTTGQGGKRVYIYIDDSTLPEADQTRVTGISFQGVAPPPPVGVGAKSPILELLLAGVL